jgi:hypothetical protein
MNQFGQSPNYLADREQLLMEVDYASVSSFFCVNPMLPQGFRQCVSLAILIHLDFYTAQSGPGLRHSL